MKEILSAEQREAVESMGELAVGGGELKMPQGRIIPSLPHIILAKHAGITEDELRRGTGKVYAFIALAEENPTLKTLNLEEMADTIGLDTNTFVFCSTIILNSFS